MNEEKKNIQFEENGTPLTDKQLEKVTGGNWLKDPFHSIYGPRVDAVREEKK